MAWFVLLLSAVCEAVWATALGHSQGLTEPAATVVFVVGVTLSMVGLGWAMKQIPIGTAYAVWVGVGAALTVAWSILSGAEPFSIGKVVFIAGIVAAVIGLKLVPAAAAISPDATAGPVRMPRSPRSARRARPLRRSRQ
ncbi:DMT family transporter [Microbacterium oleivorans]|uniref:Multidrug efflux SMR transporter n=1 Tax=Microbacterium oleivorans TaxID=273677 RepID=A0A7D5IRI0_9MICO|nr:multidrug efflux SMR transporter [Microbacterium oleivorans]QLD12641.1 multidrug efflux SMR transporter [Microbacterium oleivorans]